MSTHEYVIQNLNSFKLPPNFRGRSALVVQLWWSVQATLFRGSPQFMYGFRRWLLRCFGAKVGRGVLIRPSVKVTYPWNITINDYAWIGDDVTLYSLAHIHVGYHSVVSQKCYLCAGSHDYRAISFDIFAKPITIEDEVWVATDVYIAPGVRVGRGAVVGARSSVFSDLPAEMISLGSPAKPYKSRI